MKKSTNTKYYVYLRKSSEGEDRQVQSIERQADEVQKLVSYQGLTVVGTFEECRSAMTPNNRPKFLAMIKGIKAGKANGIICWHLNRLARNPLESGIIQQLLEDGKIQSIVTRDREYTAADNSIIFSVESSLATQYSKDLGKMTKSGMEKKVSQGIAPIRAPLGYLNTKMAEHGSNYIIKDPERFEIVRKAWEMLLSGTCVPSEILRIMTSELGLKPRLTKKSKSGKLSLSCLYDIFNNWFYTGLFQYKGQLCQGKHEAMITVGEFESAQRILGRKGRPRKQKHAFTYTGMITCGECGCAITATEKLKLIKSTGMYRSYTYYYCTQRKRGVKCESRKILKVEELESQIVDTMEDLAITDVFAKLAITIIQSNAEPLQAQAEVIEKQQEKELANTKKEIKNLLQLRISDMITDVEYQQEKQLRENKMMMLQQKIKQGEYSPYFIFKGIESKFNSLVNLKERFIVASEEGRKTIFSSIGGNHTLIGEKLNIDKPLWLQAVEKKKKEVEAEISRFELEKYVDIKAFTEHFSDMFPLMCALVEEVGTIVEKELGAGENNSNK